MKITHTILVLVCWLLSGCFNLSFCNSMNENYNSGIQINNDIDLSKETILNQIKSDEYKITFDKVIDRYQSPNRSNNIRFIYNNDGFIATERIRDVSGSSGWSVQFKASGYSRKNNLPTNFSGREIFTSGNSAYCEDENIIIKYLNDENGMRQDFIIKKRAEGDGLLSLKIDVTTALSMTVNSDEVSFGNGQFKYSGLKVWDSNGKFLNAYFENEIKSFNSAYPSAKSFSITVDDKDAAYPITIDPLSTSPNWTAEANQASAGWGYSLSTAGDVNGDGYSDVIVGAPYYDNGLTNMGRVFVYYGSASGLPVSSNWNTLGGQANALYGTSVSTAGDVNGDGYSDVIIGAPNYDNGNTNEGRVFVFYGSASGLPGTANWTSELNQDSAYFGISVSTAGDINGDGYSDVIVGASYYNNGQNDEGRAYVFNGSASGLSASESWTGESNQARSYFGCSVATAGDVNGDGYSDIVVGAWGFDNGNTNEGKIFAYFGSASGVSASANWTSEGNQDTTLFGQTVATAGDVNGDGYSDIIVGAPTADNGQKDEGRAYVYYGSAGGPSATPDWAAEGNQINGDFGYSVATAGDVNGDGYADVVIGAITYDNSMTDDGKAFVYFGSATGLNATAGWTASSAQTFSLYGNCVATAGDVNGDGFSDVLVGAYFYSNGQSNEGRSYCYYGGANGLGSTVNWIVESNQQNTFLGSSVSTAGDVNGDGYNDVIISAPYYSNGQSNEGIAYLYYGSPNGLSSTPAWSAEGNVTTGYFGNTVGTAGDVNGDGYADVIVASISNNVSIYLGSALGLSMTPQIVLAPPVVQNNMLYGFSVSTAGDVNGDGFSDVLVGVPYYYEYNQYPYFFKGRAYVYYGSPSGMNKFNYTYVNGTQDTAEFGQFVSTAGDVNGDGYSDILIGARNFDTGVRNAGKCYVYYGSANGLDTNAAWTKTGSAVNEQFGQYLNLVGDVNGDSYSDISIYSTGTNTLSLFNGSSSGLPGSPSQTIPVSYAFSSGAGDVNGDGYSDLIYGEYSYTSGQYQEGRILVANGSPAGLSGAAWIYQSNLENAQLGYRVSSAGDVNGDGYSDIIAGARYYTNVQFAEGAAFVFYGNGNTSKRATVQQYKPGSSNIIYSSGVSGSNGQVRFNIFGRSPFGRTFGKMVYEFKENGIGFSGSPITNSTQFSGAGSFVNLGTAGTQLNHDASGLLNYKEYKWRARVQYDLASNPFQKFGTWKYYTNFVPLPFGCIKAQVTLPPTMELNSSILLQGRYNSATNTMTGDSIKIILRNVQSPYEALDTSKQYAGSNGMATYYFPRATNNVKYYYQIKHRSSIETWSSGGVKFTSSSMNYNFSTYLPNAYGNNMATVDNSPLAYALFSGDVNQDKTIDLSDIGIVFNDANSFASGYVVSDLTGDDFVDLSDLTITYNNSNDFVNAITP